MVSTNPKRWLSNWWTHAAIETLYRSTEQNSWGWLSDGKSILVGTVWRFIWRWSRSECGIRSRTAIDTVTIVGAVESVACYGSGVRCKRKKKVCYLWDCRLLWSSSDGSLRLFNVVIGWFPVSGEYWTIWTVALPFMGSALNRENI